MGYIGFYYFFTLLSPFLPLSTDFPDPFPASFPGLFAYLGASDF